MKNAVPKRSAPSDRQGSPPALPTRVPTNPHAAGPFGSVTILGIRVDCVSPSETLTEIDHFVASRTPHHIVTADASMVVTARHDPALRAIIEAADLVTPDGFGILWASRQMRTPVPHKVSGVDLVGELCRLSPAKGYRIFFFGAGPGVAEEAAVKMRVLYPGTQIVGTRDGFFTPAQEPEVVAQIQATRPDIVLVALGIPKQEKWIARYKDILGAAVLVGVGGSFDVFSGRVRRAPPFMQQHGFEWLYRLYKNPRKFSKVMTLPEFAWLTLRQRFGGVT